MQTVEVPPDVRALAVAFAGRPIVADAIVDAIMADRAARAALVTADRDSIRIAEQFAALYRSGAQGASMDADAAMTLALSLDDMLAALASPASPKVTEPVAVKPLEWRELTSPREDGPGEPNGDWEADTVLGIYHIECQEAVTSLVEYKLWRGDDWLTIEDTAEACKAAAWRDFEQRIRSALSASPITEVPEGMVLVPREVTPRISRVLEAAGSTRAIVTSQDVWAALIEAAGATP